MRLSASDGIGSAVPDATEANKVRTGIRTHRLSSRPQASHVQSVLAPKPSQENWAGHDCSVATLGRSAPVFAGVHFNRDMGKLRQLVQLRLVSSGCLGTIGDDRYN